MKIQTTPKDGLLLLMISWLLYIPAFPLDKIHQYLKSRFSKKINFPFTKNWGDWEKEGAFIELWYIVWLCISLLILKLSVEASLFSRIMLSLIVLIRGADLLQAIIAAGLYLGEIHRRSIGRSYILLIFSFFELAALLSSVQFLVGQSFTIANEAPTWHNAYYYSLRNMLTIGGGDIITQTSFGYFTFGMIRIVQSAFGVLVITMALARTIQRKQNGS